MEDEEPEPPPRRTPDGLAQRQIVVVLAVVAVVALIGILIISSARSVAVTRLRPTSTATLSIGDDADDDGCHDDDADDEHDDDADNDHTVDVGDLGPDRPVAEARACRARR